MQVTFGAGDAPRHLDGFAAPTYPSCMAQEDSGPESLRRTFVRGRFYEDFKPGEVYRHHWGRTLEAGEAQLFATGTMNALPLYFNKLHAQALGHEQVPVHPLFVMNVVFGMTVEDLSEQALAHLGYWNMRFPRFVYPGDTLLASSEVLDKRESEKKPDRGIVHVRTTGVNQRGEEVCVYERRILVKKRSAYGGR